MPLFGGGSLSCSAASCRSASWSSCSGSRLIVSSSCGATAFATGDDAALTEEQEDAIAKLFNRMDVSGDGNISVQEAIKALSGARSATSTETQFVRLLGLDDMTRIHHEEGTRRDKLVAKFRALDADGDDTLSLKEFRRAVVSATRQDVTADQKLALDP